MNTQPWFACAVGVAIATSAGAEDDGEPRDPDAVAANTRWVGAALDGFHLEVDVTEQRLADLAWAIRVEARLGALGTSWTQPDLTPDPDGTLRITLVPPGAAHLDPLADDYVTDLRVLVVGAAADGHVSSIVSAPPAFLAWPNGPSAPPVVWDLAAMRSQAPAGVVDAVVRATLGDLSHIDRVGPPLERTSPIPYDPDGTE